MEVLSLKSQKKQKNSKKKFILKSIKEINRGRMHSLNKERI